MGGDRKNNNQKQANKQPKNKQTINKKCVTIYCKNSEKSMRRRSADNNIVKL